MSMWKGKTMILSLLLISSLVAVQVPAEASTIPIVGGQTTILLDSDLFSLLSGANISFSPEGSATLSGLTLTLPITGGTVDTDTEEAILLHLGSGLSFSRILGSLVFANFLVDVNLGTETGGVTGDVSGRVLDFSNVPLFTIGSGYELFLTPQAAFAFSAFFGLPNLNGERFGAITFAPTLVPEPDTMILIGAGLGLLALRKVLVRS